MSVGTEGMVSGHWTIFFLVRLGSIRPEIQKAVG